MPDWVVAIILGIIEGVTEFLPISSTGHLLLAEHWLPIQSEFLRSDFFTIVIQPGAVAAVVMVFWKRLVALARDWKKKEARDYLLKMLVAFAITGAGGLAIKTLGFELPEDVLPVALAILVGGILFLAVEAWLKSRSPVTEVTWIMAVAMGIGQLLAAVFPGLSRSGATIMIALALGLGRPQATEFSFILGIPTLLAAAGKETFDNLQNPPPHPLEWGLVFLGSVVSAVTAFVAVKWLLRFVQSHTFTGFGIYRVILGILILVAR